MISVKILNKKSGNTIRVMKGTLSEFREEMKKDPHFELMKDGGVGISTKALTGEWLDLYRLGLDQYKLRVWDTDEEITGPYGEVMYQAVKKGLIKTAAEVVWEWENDEYWDLVGRDNDLDFSGYEYRLLKFADAIRKIESSLDIIGEMKFKSNK